MSIEVSLTPTEEARLSIEAMRNGLATAELAALLLRRHLTTEPEPQEEELRTKLRQWQQDTNTKTTPEVSVRDLFARWAEEDSNKSEEEIAADEQLWQDYQQGIDEERAQAGMRTLFNV